MKSFGLNGKNLKRKVTCKDLYNLDLTREDDYKYWSFNPSNAQDFTKRQYYGEIQGDKMVLCYILFMSGKSPLCS